MPAFNEAEILETSVVDVVEGLRAEARTFEVVVCQNGSTDTTLGLAHALAEKFPQVVVESSDVADYGLALEAGVLAAPRGAGVNFDGGFFHLAVFDAPLA